MAMEAEDMVEVEDSMVDTLEDFAAGILEVDTVLLLHLEDILVGAMVVTTEDTEVGIMVGIVKDLWRLSRWILW